jgi:uncharacterized pyridoxamine 5'-phosphate oxidase family protein
MDYLKELNRIMESQSEIALATAAENAPNVRIVNFYYDTQNKGVIYFSTFKNNRKVKEFAKNSQVAFTTIPVGSNEHVKTNNGTVQKSNLTIYDLKEAFIKKIPDYGETIEQAGSHLVLYEIHFKEAVVTLDFTKIGKVTL